VKELAGAIERGLRELADAERAAGAIRYLKSNLEFTGSARPSATSSGRPARSARSWWWRGFAPASTAPPASPPARL